MSAREARVLDSTACTVVLTEIDRRLLAEMAPTRPVHHIQAPFAASLEPDPAALDGSPAVVTLASATWEPSRAAVRELVTTLWPGIRHRLPDAVLHVFGRPDGLGTGDGVVFHPPPSDSRSAFPTGAVALIPVRHPTGVPMKALEAWARGLPLVVDRATAEALGAEDGVSAVVARGPDDWGETLARLVEDSRLAETVVSGGRRILAERHDPASVADRLSRVYRWASDRTSHS
jgi:hypothetical protein